MNVLELSVHADAEAAEAVAAAFNEYAYGGSVIEQVVTPEPGESLDPVHPFTVRAFLLMDETLDEKRRALEEAVWRLGLLRPMGELVTRKLKEEDYANTWKKFYSVLHVGAHTVVKPSWLRYLPQPNDLIIELDPGMAFGTGLHPTTRLCLDALETYVKPGARMLDVGTGSGILAIAAAKAGAAFVDARDIDHIAVETAQKNVELNGVQDRLRVSRASLTLESDPALFDVITANIFADTIAELAPALEQHLALSGVLIASGILVERARLVEDALRAVGIRVAEQAQEEDWLVMVGKRRETGD